LVPNPTASGLIACTFSCCIHVLVMQSRNHFVVPPVSLERTLQVFLGKTEKAGRATVFLYWHHLAFTGLILPLHMMPFPYFMFCFFFFLKKKKKKWGEFAEFYFLGSLDIVCIFA
jgi:hypothetical protein